MTNSVERMWTELDIRAYRSVEQKLSRLNVRELHVLMSHYGRTVKYASDWPKVAMVEELIPLMQADPASPLYEG